MPLMFAASRADGDYGYVRCYYHSNQAHILYIPQQRMVCQFESSNGTTCDYYFDPLEDRDYLPQFKARLFKRLGQEINPIYRKDVQEDDLVGPVNTTTVDLPPISITKDTYKVHVEVGRQLHTPGLRLYIKAPALELFFKYNFKETSFCSALPVVNPAGHSKLCYRHRRAYDYNSWCPTGAYLDYQRAATLFAEDNSGIRINLVPFTTCGLEGGIEFAYGGGPFSAEKLEKIKTALTTIIKSLYIDYIKPNDSVLTFDCVKKEVK